MEVAESAAAINGVLVSADIDSGKAVTIERIKYISSL
jgi:calcineurin-like phosphoesterase